jgi:GNAT superfamily N-acetyltransferase
MIYELINKSHLPKLSKMYIEAFNAPPWNEQWTTETVNKRLRQMMNCEGSIGLVSFKNNSLNGMVLGNIEYFYDCTHFDIKEFCVRLSLRKTGIGTQLLNEFEKRLLEYGVDEVYLSTSRTDETEMFYQKRGFKSWDSMVVMGKSLHAEK